MYYIAIGSIFIVELLYCCHKYCYSELYYIAITSIVIMECIIVLSQVLI